MLRSRTLLRDSHQPAVSRSIDRARTSPCPCRGSRGLPKTLLGETLGPEVTITFRPGAMLMTVDERVLAPDRRAEWSRRLSDLADRAGEASRHRRAYGMRALKSFRPNDPSRPTICLVHGLNSSSGGFVHMIPWLEEAGYGIVVYDYPFNRAIDESCAGFARDWTAFRTQAQDKLPWAIVAHSMGALLARSLVEDDASWAGDVSSLIMIAPVNHGSHLAKVQTVIQLMNGLKAINGKNTAKAMTESRRRARPGRRGYAAGKRVLEGTESPAAPAGRFPITSWPATAAS